MYRRVIFFKIVLAIVLVAVIIGGGLAVYRLGWGQGYLVGTAQASSEVVEPGLMVPAFGGHLYRPFYPGFGFPFFGLCFGIGFIFLIMFLLGGVLKPWGRRRWAGHPHHGKWEDGPMPPWAKDWQEFRQKKTAEREAGEEPDVEQPAAD
jgi:hypothetical protein